MAQQVSGAEVVEKQDAFPFDGLVTAKESAKYLKIGLSTYWAWVKDERLPPAIKLSARISRWKASDIRRIALEGMAEKSGGGK